MAKDDNSKLIIVRPTDVSSSKTSDFAEKIISGILESGELDVIGIGDAMFLSCAAVNMATEIANVFIDEICIDTFEVPLLEKINFVSTHLSQNKKTDFDKLVKAEESEMKNPYEQTISIARDSSLEKLLTLSLLKLSRFDRLRIMAAGGAINDAILLALRLTAGKISKDPIGIGVISLYSINTRSDDTKKIVAISIYIKKKTETQYSKRHTELLKKIRAGC
jgi:hypothetical protein